LCNGINFLNIVYTIKDIIRDKSIVEIAITGINMVFMSISEVAITLKHNTGKKNLIIIVFITYLAISGSMSPGFFYLKNTPSPASKK
jgi:hypothetical protein